VNREDPNALFQLIGQYNQDFTFEFDNERAAFDEFALHAYGDPRRAALVALDNLLATATTEAELERRLKNMAFAYIVTAAGHESYRAFLLMLRDWLEESLRTMPTRLPASEA
jgi:hypothetical protein